MQSTNAEAENVRVSSRTSNTPTEVESIVSGLVDSNASQPTSNLTAQPANESNVSTSESFSNDADATNETTDVRLPSVPLPKINL